jgi:hypothetical protein
VYAVRLIRHFNKCHVLILRMGNPNVHPLGMRSH